MLFRSPKNFLSLNGLTSLSKEFAEAIYDHLGCGWEMNGLTEMSDEVANILLRNPWHLSFTGLTSISDCMVNHLKSIGPGYFTFGFNHLKVVTPKVINALADQAEGRHNDLNGLTSLSVEVAEALVKLQGDMNLNSLESLSPEVAEVLATHKGSLMLNGLRSLSPEAAETLAKHEGIVSLEGLTELTTQSAELLKKNAHQKQWWDKSLRLNRMTSLPVNLEGLESLSEYQEALHLNGLTSLSVDAAKILSRHKGSLELNGLSSVSSEAAHWLAKRGGRLYLHGQIGRAHV